FFRCFFSIPRASWHYPLSLHAALPILSDIGPSVLAALGVPGECDVLGLGEVARACVFLVDGLGWVQLQRHADVAPFLSSAAGRSDRKSTRLNSSHDQISYAVFCLNKKI